MKRNPLTIVIGALLLIVFVLLLFVFQVRTTEVAVVTTFGRVTRPEGPGAHFKWPWPVQSVHKFDQRIHNFKSKFAQVLTSDNNSLLIAVFVGWNISDATTFLTRFGGDTRRAEESLDGLVRNAYSGVVGRHPFSHFISTDAKELKFSEIEAEIQSRLQADCRALTNGLNIAFLGIERIGLPESVTKLVFERMESEREVLVSQIQGDALAQASAIKARADSDSAKLLAEADAQATRTQGEAEKIASASYAVFNQEPDLAVYLLKLKALEQFLQSGATIIADEHTAPLDVMKSQKPGSIKK